MYENLGQVSRKARKSHQCDWCGETIEKGERYDYQKYIWNGKLYEWKSHESCARIVSAIWEYADPYEGLDSDEFMDVCHEVCQKFVCPDCEKWDGEYLECANDEAYCINRMDEFFKTHEMYATRNGYYKIWRVREKKQSKKEGDEKECCLKKIVY